MVAGRARGRALLDYTHGKGSDLLVMGAYEHTGLRALFTGSATKHLLRRAPCAIFAAH